MSHSDNAVERDARSLTTTTTTTTTTAGTGGGAGTPAEDAGACGVCPHCDAPLSDDPHGSGGEPQLCWNCGRVARGTEVEYRVAYARKGCKRCNTGFTSVRYDLTSCPVCSQPVVREDNRPWIRRDKVRS
jgi:hypothetical protein